MVEDIVSVRVPLADTQWTTLRFPRKVYSRHEADARAAGLSLPAYLSRKVMASGVGGPVGQGYGEAGETAEPGRFTGRELVSSAGR